MPVMVTRITDKTPDWESRLNKAVEQADEHCMLYVDTSAKAAMAHTEAVRLGKVVRVEVHSHADGS